MKKLYFFSIKSLFLLVPLVSIAGVEIMQPLNASNNVTTKETHFRAQFAVVADEPELRRNWENSSQNIKIETVNSTRINSAVGTVIVFQGCKPNSSGKCSVTVDFSVTSPNGERSKENRAQIWSSEPLRNKLMLGASSANLVFKNPNATGLYKIHARLTDQISGEILELSTDLNVESA